MIPKGKGSLREPSTESRSLVLLQLHRDPNHLDNDTVSENTFIEFKTYFK